ncbi:DUF6573 family protein [Legionella fallonii]|uniref:Uncharacterized protein n=1 Tax=Legionella fallonii LLAP-10 TaxID=1212491 RepID=A0A098GBG4_9GAMM|nr:DUF6573 family protein [Legionella fallonii]CEG59305.1 protein of unknown function [Legionella fallonii LLAP-10]
MNTHANPTENKPHTLNQSTLINISEQADDFGYADFPVMVTQAAWDKYIKNNDNIFIMKRVEYLKLNNILLMLARSIIRLYKRSVINFRVYPLPGHGMQLQTAFVLLKARVLRDDNGNPTIIIMLPREQCRW